MRTTTRVDIYHADPYCEKRTLFITHVFYVLRFVMGTFVSWNHLALICASVPIIFFLTMLFMCETPRYLLSKGKLTKATKAMKWLRGASNSEEIEPELTKVQYIIETNYF